MFFKRCIVLAACFCCSNKKEWNLIAGSAHNSRVFNAEDAGLMLYLKTVNNKKLFEI